MYRAVYEYWFTKPYLNALSQLYRILVALRVHFPRLFSEINGARAITRGMFGQQDDETDVASARTDEALTTCLL